MERITSNDFRKKSEEEQAAIRDAVKKGEMEIISSGGGGTNATALITASTAAQELKSGGSDISPDWNIDNSLQAPSVLDLHPQVMSARIEELRTAAETRSAAMIAKGNIAQANLLLKFLDTINANEPLRALLNSQAQEYLPQGTKSIDDVPPSLRLSILIRSLADVTTMPEKMHDYEKARGRHNKEIAEIQAMVAFARELYGSVNELPKATSQLKQINSSLVPYIAEQRQFMQLRTRADRDRAATGAMILTARISGVTGGVLGGLVGGLAAMPTYAGEAVRAVAERAPLPAGGGALGLTAYALTNVGKQVFTPEYFGQAFLSFTVGAIALPAVVGIAEGFAHARQH